MKNAGLPFINKWSDNLKIMMLESTSPKVHANREIVIIEFWMDSRRILDENDTKTSRNTPSLNLVNKVYSLSLWLKHFGYLCHQSYTNIQQNWISNKDLKVFFMNWTTYKRRFYSTLSKLCHIPILMKRQHAFIFEPWNHDR